MGQISTENAATAQSAKAPALVFHYTRLCRFHIKGRCWLGSPTHLLLKATEH